MSIGFNLSLSSSWLVMEGWSVCYDKTRPQFIEKMIMGVVVGDTKVIFVAYDRITFVSTYIYESLNWFKFSS